MSYISQGGSNVTDSKNSIGSFAYHDAQSRGLGPEGEIGVFLSELKDRSMNTGVPVFSVVSKAINFWRDVRGELRRAGLSNIPEPLVAVSAQGSIHFSWELSKSYVEAEFFESLSEVFFESDSDGVFESAEFGFQEAEQSARWVSRRIGSDSCYQE